MAQLHRGRRLMGEINVVPYIDVMLVLLIIFMITAPLLNQGVKVDLPRASAKTLPADMQQNKPIVLSLDAQGDLYLSVNGRTVGPAAPAAIRSRVAAALAANPDRPVLFKADAATAYGVVMKAMVLLQSAGARKVGFITLPPAERRRGT
jgi:biopolymer transport protein TolR